MVEKLPVANREEKSAWDPEDQLSETSLRMHLSLVLWFPKYVSSSWDDVRNDKSWSQEEHKIEILF